MAGEPLVRVSDLHRRYGPVHALRGLSFELERGEVLGFLGPNGAGKSTTMRIVCGVLAPSAGRVAIAGHDLAERPREAKRRLGYLPEHPPLYPELTVDEYLAFAARLRGVRAVRRALGRVKERCGLGEVGRRLIGNLSKGFRQRVGIAQALVHEPELVVLDEPTTGLDPNQIREIRALVAELREGHGVLVSTHVLAEVQATCDRVQILHRGELVLDRRLAELRRAGGALRVRLRRPPRPADLAAVAGVRAAHPLDGRAFRLEVDDAEAAAEAVAEAAVAAGWGLAELAPDRDALEETFVALTCADAPPAAPTAPEGTA